MAKPRLLVVQPGELDPPGPLGEWAQDAGAELDLVQPAKDPLPALDGYDGVICLGGPMGATDDRRHPWLADVRRLLAEAVTTRLPVLAICLGAQLLAVATGGRVAVGEAGPEVGPGLVAKRDLAWRDPLFAELPFMPDVFQSHADAIVALPPNTELLASAPRYPNQAFRIGPTAYGIQFHVEITAAAVLSWARHDPAFAAAARPGDLEPGRLATLQRDIEETWRPFVERFVRLTSGELAPVPPPRPGLPLA
ncbi:MAG TPA: type 1 glutamine amidotransferase [Actinophytocola sp.]|uniref:type 1 glutamine amidotransferase n=1 Tax=Actinophytocola sp. TaxID=1872138 RepID=UPI002DDDAA36|nr:type 1 glutamine amidotransferase [Actinophytocola sp.]HEV2778672.1 type 1 glutamine amidotransferase [Actinophytocola sp.]